MKSFRFAMTLLTTIPSGFKEIPDDKIWRGTVLFFPVCGYILAFFSVVPFYALSSFFYVPDIIEAIGITTFLFLLTGGLHLDGFADSCDALMCSVTRERRIEILHDSRLGAFAGIGLILLLCAKISALFILIGYQDYAEIFCMIVISRFMMVILTKVGKFFPFERGMGREIIGRVSMTTLIIAFILTAPCIFISLHMVIISLLLVAVIAYFNYRVNSKLGGISGDILGASVELTETIGLVLLTIKPIC